MWYSQKKAQGLHTEVLANGVMPNTLTTYLGEFLLEAERRYLGRDINFTILGIVFMPDAPHIRIIRDSQLIVQLCENAAEDYDEALFQLSHEIVHLLAPVSGGANVLEEGLATHFSYEMMRIQKINKATDHAGYIASLRHVKALFKHDANAIVALRNGGRSRFIDMDASYIHNVTGCDPHLADDLARMF